VGVTVVGSYTGSASPNGTLDQGGNVGEWNEAIVFQGTRGLRGGSWYGGALAASSRSNNGPELESDLVGFRVASLPAPGTGLLLASGLMGLCWTRRRRLH
jgi:formylglycine-generating enzyme required for sulfatase activity